MWAVKESLHFKKKTNFIVVLDDPEGEGIVLWKRKKKNRGGEGGFADGKIKALAD